MKKRLIILMIAFLTLSSFGQEDWLVDEYEDTLNGGTYITDEETLETEAAQTVETITIKVAEPVEETEIYEYEDIFIEEQPREREKRERREREPRSRKRNARKVIRCHERFASGMEAFERGRYSRAINLLSVVRNQCGNELDAADSVYFFLGMSYVRARKFDDARIEFRTIIEDFPHSEFIEKTYFLIAYSSFMDAPIIQRDSRLLRRAEREFASFISGFPTSVLADSARIYLDSITDKLFERELMIANFYEIIRRHESAIIYYEAMLQDFAGHRRIPEVRLLLARNLIAAQRFSEVEEQLKILENEQLFLSEIESLRRRNEVRRRRR